MFSCFWYDMLASSINKMFYSVIWGVTSNISTSSIYGNTTLTEPSAVLLAMNWSTTKIIKYIDITIDLGESFFVLTDKDTVISDEAKTLFFDIPLILLVWQRDGTETHVTVVKGNFSKIKLIFAGRC